VVNARGLRQAAATRSPEAQGSSAGVPPWGTAAGFAVVTLLGGAGWWLSRRRRSA
jgi:LPXTG-motif cell wall-anchored protein